MKASIIELCGGAAHLLLALALAGFPGCAGQKGGVLSERNAAALHGPADAGAPSRQVSSVQPQKASSAGLPAECETIAEILGGLAGGAVRRSLGELEVPGAGRALTGCLFAFHGSAKALEGAQRPEDSVASALAGRGLARDIRYDADGPNGTSFVLRGSAVVCVVRAGWDVEDPGDPEYTPSDDYDLFAGCADSGGRGS